jgi:hypothetical protein
MYDMALKLCVTICPKIMRFLLGYVCVRMWYSVIETAKYVSRKINRLSSYTRLTICVVLLCFMF